VFVGVTICGNANSTPTVCASYRSQQPVTCQWGPWSDWSECDGCSKSQTRPRGVRTFAQFGGTPCSGERSQRRSCSTTRGCPLQEDCSGRFRCQSGQCISVNLVCNGDQDCEEDGLDEQFCDESTATAVCDEHKIPPNAELTGKGFDVLTGKLKSSVINTKSFGGQCRKVFSGDHRNFYRLPQSLLGYTFQVSVDNDFSDEFYNSSWSYMKHNDNREWFKGGHNYRIFHKELSNTKAHRLMIIKNQVEVAQFQNSPPQYLPLSEGFWKALSALPAVYEYEAYRTLLDTYGTHFLSEGSLGGQYQLLLELDTETMSTSQTDYHRCVTHVKRRLFRKKTTTRCDKLVENLKETKGFSNNRLPVKTNIIGGDPAFVAGLGMLDLEDPAANMKMYSQWAGSVKIFPRVIKPKLRPLYELVKEVPCATLKKLHLKRAMEEYLDADHPCHCRPCLNNGQPLLEGTGCSCVCRPDTAGHACEQGTVLEEQPGVLHGLWSCWSPWSSCSGGQRLRTRSCNNPAPRLGGRHCVGESSESRPCEDPDLQHLQMMEPHCFDPAVMPLKTCNTPPPLRNGFITVRPKDLYPVGSKVTYSCIEGYHLLGDGVAESTGCGLTSGTVCTAPALPSDVTAVPWKMTYDIGETLSLSCPPGKERTGPSEVSCDSSLNWSPSLKDSSACVTKVKLLPEKVTLQCKAWEKLAADQCVCRMPYECGTSLEVCATNMENGRTNVLSVCKVATLQCLGRSYVLAEESACDWPEPKAMPCSACRLEEKCDGERFSTCVCQDPGECAGQDQGARVCAKLAGSSAGVTLTECEVGLRRCHGEKVSVVSIRPCEP
uniref:Complement component C7 n=1 Tax=Scleropages formosus TaxID=113540 RepID=A0A8C9VYK7_SCLFO